MYSHTLVLGKPTMEPPRRRYPDGCSFSFRRTRGSYTQPIQNVKHIQCQANHAKRCTFTNPTSRLRAFSSTGGCHSLLGIGGNDSRKQFLVCTPWRVRQYVQPTARACYFVHLCRRDGCRQQLQQHHRGFEPKHHQSNNLGKPVNPGFDLDGGR